MRLFTSWKECTATPSCFRLLPHCVRAAASRTFCTAGTRSAIKMAMMAMTTSSSMSVKPRGRREMRDETCDMKHPFRGRGQGSDKNDSRGSEKQRNGRKLDNKGANPD